MKEIVKNLEYGLQSVTLKFYKWKTREKTDETGDYLQFLVVQRLLPSK